MAKIRPQLRNHPSPSEVLSDKPQLNVLSVDVEDYFHVEAFASRVSVHSWDSFAPRVEGNLDRILGLFDRYRVRATFFVLGWVAERCPGLVRRIACGGHEIACHGYGHRRLHHLSPEEFRADLRHARRILMTETEQPVTAYRAPSFSIVTQTMWALDILAEEGFRIDSSIFPVRHDLYGVPGAQRFPHWRTTSGGKAIFEFPPSTIRQGYNNWGVGGGGYLRLIPYGLTRWAIRQINVTEHQPAMVYLHPWEIDPGQPRISAGIRSRLRHYTNLSKMEDKIERLLRDFQFSTLADVCSRLEVFHSGTLPTEPQ